MKGRYELRHALYGRGYRSTRLDQARRELAHAVPSGEWFIFDRQERQEVTP